MVRMSGRATWVKVSCKAAEIQIVIQGNRFVLIDVPNDHIGGIGEHITEQHVVQSTHLSIKYITVRLGTFCVDVAGIEKCYDGSFHGVGI